MLLSCSIMPWVSFLITARTKHRETVSKPRAGVAVLGASCGGTLVCWFSPYSMVREATSTWEGGRFLPQSSANPRRTPDWLNHAVTYLISRGQETAGFVLSLRQV